MPKVTINGKELVVENNMTILQACELLEIEIPRFCYHERLSIAGNCRMCLVEVNNSPKPVASCAMPVAENMIINTNTPLVKKAREGVMELLLINHPLDCPICDQGGECDLQDQAMAYGRPLSRFKDDKRSVVDKYLGPLIATHMTRCIHCTRCVRFSTEIAGNEEMGTSGRGENMEIMSYLDRAVTSELSGNMIDICPVGALTSKPLTYKARSWEYEKTESIDVLDAVGSNIRIDTRDMKVMRILPRLNEEINEEWISDKTRFSYDALQYQRLDRPYIRTNGNLREASWEEAIDLMKNKIQSYNPEEIAFLIGDMVDAETIMVLKDLATSLDIKNIDCRIDGTKIENKVRMSYLFNTSIMGIEESDLCLFVGANPREDSTIINSRFRKNYLSSDMKFYIIGKADIEYTYPMEDLGNDLKLLEKILAGEHFLSEKLKNAKKPMIVIGNEILKRDDCQIILNICYKISTKFSIINDKWNGFNILHQAASRVAALDLNFLPGENGSNYDEIIKSVQEDRIKLLYLIGVDQIKKEILKDCFVIYQGHHGDIGAENADIILPGAAYTEKNATYVNLEGRIQETIMALEPPYLAKEDWKIVKMIADSLNVRLIYHNLDQVRERMSVFNSIFKERNMITRGQIEEFGISGDIENQPIILEKSDYYLNNIISKFSKIMLQCSKEFSNKREEV